MSEKEKSVVVVPCVDSAEELRRREVAALRREEEERLSRMSAEERGQEQAQLSRMGALLKHRSQGGGAAKLMIGGAKSGRDLSRAIAAARGDKDAGVSRAAELLKFKRYREEEEIMPDVVHRGGESKGNAAAVDIVDVLQSPDMVDMRDAARSLGAALPPETAGSPWRRVNFVDRQNTDGMMRDCWHMSTSECLKWPLVRTSAWAVVWGIECIPNRGYLGQSQESMEPCLLFKRRESSGDIWGTAYPMRMEYLLMWDDPIWDHRKDEFLRRTLEFVGLDADSNLERGMLTRVTLKAIGMGMLTARDEGDWERLVSDLAREAEWGEDFVVSRMKFLDDGAENPHYVELLADGTSRRGGAAKFARDEKSAKVYLPPTLGAAREG